MENAPKSKTPKLVSDYVPVYHYLYRVYDDNEDVDDYCRNLFSGIVEAKSRALDNMGRSYAKMGEFKKAINM